MAKVYDALKRLEQERSREANAPPVSIVPKLEGSWPAKPVSRWRRWPWSWLRSAVEGMPGVEARAPGAGDHMTRIMDALDQLREQQDILRAMDGRLAELASREHAAVERLAEIERTLRRDLDQHVGELGRTLDRRAVATADRISGHVERLQSRQSLLLGIVGAVLLMTLLR
jgi:hypothetical protein